MHRDGSLASWYTGQPTGTPNCRPPKLTFWDLSGRDVVGGVDAVVVVVVLAGVSVVDVVLVLALVLVGVDTLGPELPPHAANNTAPNAAAASARAPIECRSVV